jgi:putative membrane protein
MVRRLPEFVFFAALFLWGVLAGRFVGLAPAWIGSVAVWVLAAPALVALVQAVGWRRAVVAWGGLGVFALVIESIGLATCWPYGCFTYGEGMGVSLFGFAPLALMAAWPPLVLGAWALAPGRGWCRVVWAVFLVVAADVVLDPGAVAFGYWHYAEQDFYGVPWSNYAGWVFSGSLGVLWVWGVLGSALVDRLVAVTYCCSLVFWAGVVVGLGYWIPASTGIFLLCFLVLFPARKFLAFF